MTQSLRKSNNSSEDPIEILKNDIAVLETDLEAIKRALASFEVEIQSRLNDQILRIMDLFALYKKQKAAKKLKRLEQKKKGKNYKEPRQQVFLNTQSRVGTCLPSEEDKELKRLFKEAIVLVHPDKFHRNGEEDIKKATSITAQLNGIYKRGDLEELINLYQFIINGTEESPDNHISEIAVNSKIRLYSLKKKKVELSEELEKVKGSYIYQVFNTYENPDLFIDELRIQFEERIKQLEKRTRKRGGA